MKKLLFTLLTAVIATASLHAQEGEIIYADYGPEGWSHEYLSRNTLGHYVCDSALTIDLDNDGSIDLFYIGYEVPYEDYLPNVSYGALHPVWPHQYGDAYNWYCDFYKKDKTYFESYGDTISSIQEFVPELDAPKWHGGREFEWHFLCVEEGINQPNSPYLAFRIPKGDGYCYGWIEHSITFTKRTCPCCCTGWEYYHEATITVYRWAYCTIPNYPLRIGQTSFDWGVEDYEASAFANIHPNPTTGLVTIIGKDLRQVEVFNMIGQQVATAQGKGETLHIDIAELPAGVYFVRVTDEEGRKCVRKVVKE